MSLTASMWTGISGLIIHGEKMNTLGNNIANVNTVGFKGDRMDFEDFIYQNFNTAQGANQVGRGANIGAIMKDWGQGAFETTTESTDMAIGGSGFFGVSPKTTEEIFYTRAGNFRFDKDGYLVDPHGYVLQGWEIRQKNVNIFASTEQDPEFSSSIRGVGAPKDIRLEGFSAQPRHTSSITMIMNLDSVNGGDNTKRNPMVDNDKYFALSKAWRGHAVEPELPLGEMAYAYQNTIRVYDEGGAAHNITAYFDKCSDAANGNQVWEYIVTMEPSEDKRVLGGVAMAGTSCAGILMIGTLSFDSSGQLIDMSAFTLRSDANPGVAGENFKSLSNWSPTSFSSNGYPVFAPNFTGLENASYCIDHNGAPSVNSNANGKLVEFNFGLRNTNTGTGVTAWVNHTPSNPPFTAADGGADPTGALLPSLGIFADREAMATTSFAGSSSTLFHSQNGYTFGFLQNITVDKNGVLQGQYSNGVTLELYQITLYDFTSKQSLRREGGNLFSETEDSGQAIQGPANSNGLGSISSNSLEQSNVDLAREFVQMITTQRGFQASSKVITTTDSMLGEIVQLKR